METKDYCINNYHEENNEEIHEIIHNPENQNLIKFVDINFTDCCYSSEDETSNSSNENTDNENKLLIENKFLKEQLSKTLIENKNNTKIIECLKKLFEYKKYMKLSDLIIYDIQTLKKPSIIDTLLKYNSNIQLLSNLQNDFNSIDNPFLYDIKNYFVTEINDLKEFITKQQYISNNPITKMSYASDNKKNTIFVGMILFFGMGVICNYIIK
jgi:hypothetical protein